MDRQTQAQIKTISILLADPDRAERAMSTRLLSCICLCQKTLTRDLISTLYKHNTGTREVEHSVTILCRNNKEFIHFQLKTLLNSIPPFCKQNCIILSFSFTSNIFYI